MLVVRPRYSLFLSSLALALSYSASASAQEPCFERIDTGTDTSGWHPSTTNHHGPGTGWTVEGGALVGRQTGNQQGGILLTDKLYKDVEVIFEVKIDWGCDSGFFFRTTAGDRAYQVNVDHLAESGVGTIYGESFAQELRAIPYWLTNSGNAAIVAPDQNDMPIFDVATWPTLWQPTEFNEIRARVEGNPPHMQVWISGTKVMDFTDGLPRGEIDASGPLAIQVHSGGRWLPGGSVAYKNIRVKDLTVACNDPGGVGGGGAGGMAGAGGSSAGSSGTPGAGAGGGGTGAGGAGNGGGSAGAVGGGGSAGSVASAGGSGAPPSTTGGVPPTSPASSDSSGCSCSLPASSGSALGAVGALLALLGVGLFRRPAGRRRF
ncbi:MAG TPA: DUF1080 domain-containing protein [Polyangiaceae bacterium]